MRWLADENLNNDILRGLQRRSPGFDIVRAQDIGLTGAADNVLLARAAGENRIVVTHDVSTLTAHAYRRVVRGDPMPGVFEVGRGVAIRTAIDDLILLDDCSRIDEWEGQVRYLPLR